MINQSDPFAKWRSPEIQEKDLSKQQIQQEIEPKKEISQLIVEPKTRNEKEDSFSKWRKEFPSEGENDLEREIERNIAQQTSRLGETVLGLPGDLYSFAKGIFGFEPETNLPTSKSLREASEKASLGYTKPRTEFEEKTGEVMQDIASFMIPGSKQYSMLRNIGIPISANLAKEGIKLTGEDKNADAAKIGLMIGLDLLTQRKGAGGGAKKYASNLFKEMGKSLPETAEMEAGNASKYLSEIEKELTKGGSRPSTIKAIEKVREMKNEIKDGKINVKDFVSYRPSINEIIDDLGGFEYLFKPKIKERIINNLNKVKGIAIKSSEEYGEKFNPKFLKLSREANEAYAAYENSNKIAQFLNKHFGKKALGGSVKSLLSIGAPALGAVKVGTALTTGIGIPLSAAYQGFKIFNRMKNSPTLRKYYGNILQGSIQGNVSQVLRNLNALDQKLKEQDQE
jgi:hypothetical protein